jgi:hypothetical protein
VGVAVVVDTGVDCPASFDLVPRYVMAVPGADREPLLVCPRADRAGWFLKRLASKRDWWK